MCTVCLLHRRWLLRQNDKTLSSTGASSCETIMHCNHLDCIQFDSSGISRCFSTLLFTTIFIARITQIRRHRQGIIELLTFKDFSRILTKTSSTFVTCTCGTPKSCDECRIFNEWSCACNTLLFYFMSARYEALLNEKITAELLQKRNLNGT